MHINEFKAKGQELIDQMEQLISQLPQKGLKSSDCQKTFLANTLSNLEQAVNGTEGKDFVGEEYYDELKELVDREYEDGVLDEEDSNRYLELVAYIQAKGAEIPFGIII